MSVLGTPASWGPENLYSRSNLAAHTTLDNLKRICEDRINGHYRMEIIDLLKNPHLGKGDQILAVATLVRKLPVPVRKIIGDPSKTNAFWSDWTCAPADGIYWRIRPTC